MPGALDEDTSTRLVTYNGLAAIFHLLQAGLIAVLATDFALPVTTSFLNDDPANAAAGATSTLLFELPTGLAVATFSLLSAIFHGLVAGPWRPKYERWLSEGCNPLRWVEYAASASLMMVIIAQLSGIFDVVALLAIFAANAAMIGFGHLMERENVGRPVEETRWAAFWMGSAIGAVPWIGIGIHIAGGDPPGFVYAIFVSLFLFFNVFALNIWLEFKRQGRWADPITVEKTYIVLSFTAKAALA